MSEFLLLSKKARGMSATMKILVVGSGGREHALVWKLAQSRRASALFCAPGNAGIGKQATCVNIQVDDLEGLAAFAKKEKIDLTVVGPELPLTLGLVDLFQKRGLKIFGPTQKAAILESSKVFAKDFFVKYKIPTADYQIFSDVQSARAYVLKKGAPIVVKADGLAAGKGAIVCQTEKDALAAIDEILVKKAFGKAGQKIVIEEFLKGVESSFMALVSGERILPLATAKDHKAIYEGDKGPNTGGMGAVSPSQFVSDALGSEIVEHIILPTARGMKAEGRSFTGILYAGLMLTEKGPKVLEYNVRFGDPEAQSVLMRLKSDLVDLLEAAVDGRLDAVTAEWDERSSLCVVLAAGGYPGSYEKGHEIFGLNGVLDETFVFHSGTSLKDGKCMTNGGRVLGVTALGSNRQEAYQKAYNLVERISWDDVYYRKDIGL